MATKRSSDQSAASTSGRARRLATTLTLAAAIACVAPLEACGVGSSGGTSTGPDIATGLKFTHCMRAHGVPNFPDPLATGGFPRSSGLDTQSPAFQTAQKGCKYLFAAGSSGHGPTASQRTAMLKFAQCMRVHRVPNFPDPVTSSASRNTDALVEGGMMFPIGSTIDPRSPAFKRASAACAPGSSSGQPKGG
jgi:hypothetical protein